MSNKLRYLIGIALFLSFMPVRGISQTGGDQTTGAAKVENTQAKHTVKKSASSSAKQSVSKGYHATTRATGKAWKGTKQAVSKGAKATAHATGKAWSATKQTTAKGYNKVAHPHAKAPLKAKVPNHKDEKQGGTAK
jgi:hypothetical protein